MSRRGGRERKRDRVLSDEDIRTLWWGLDRDGVPGDRHVCLAMRMILTTMVRPYQAAGAEINELFDLVPPARSTTCRQAG
jgi:integrase